jgi:heme-degrading monooxygenase HmoA
MDESRKARIIFLLRVPRERHAEFLGAYERIRYVIAGTVPGYLGDQLCQSDADDEQWMITSEWMSLAHFEQWERSPGHRGLAGPLRACASEARSIRFVVRAQTAPLPAARTAPPAARPEGGRSACPA